MRVTVPVFSICARLNVTRVDVCTELRLHLRVTMGVAQVKGVVYVLCQFTGRG